MRLVNSTEITPISEILSQYAAPEWAISFLGLILTFTVVMTVICAKYCTRCTHGCAISCENANRGCSFFCNLCNGCILASTRNCVSCGEHYKTCVDTTYECATHVPGRPRREGPPELRATRALPTVRR